MTDDRKLLIHRLAFAQASIDGKPWEGDYIDGYHAEAEELLNRAEKHTGRKIILGPRED